MKSIIFISVLLVGFVANCLAQNTIDPDNKKVWKLVWKDDFNYKKRSALLKVWESQNGGDPRPSMLCSRWEENVEVGNGVIRLVNRKENRDGRDWTSGNIWTRRDFQYGYYECRYKYAAITGTNNSFWLWTGAGPNWWFPGDTDPEKRFEIDINEGHYPDIVNINVHKWAEVSIKSDHKKLQFENTDFSKDYHLFGVEWTKDELVYYVDRKEIRRIKNEWCFVPARIFLSLAIARWAGEVNEKVNGTFMEVDYVRVYNRK